MMKTQEDTKCTKETALAWAVSALNSLHNSSGYTPNQLVLGKSITLPNIISGTVQQLESDTSFDVIREQVNALHSQGELH